MVIVYKVKTFTRCQKHTFQFTMTHLNIISIMYYYFLLLLLFSIRIIIFYSQGHKVRQNTRLFYNA